MVGGGVGDEKIMFVIGGEMIDDLSVIDGGVDDGYDIGEFGFKDRVEVCRRSESCEIVVLNRVSFVLCLIFIILIYELVSLEKILMLVEFLNWVFDERVSEWEVN